MMKIGIVIVGLYVLASTIIPIVLLIYPTIVKHIVFMNMSKLIFCIDELKSFLFS
jgi:hypothetical protein